MKAVVFALKFEGAKVQSVAGWEKWVLGAAGAAAHAQLAQRLSHQRPAVLVLAGFGGALQPDLKVGDLILAANVTSARIQQQLKLSGGWRAGEVISRMEIVDSARKRGLGAETKALAVDMESEQVARYCEELGVPMVGVRCISDGVEDRMPVPPEVLIDPRTGQNRMAGLLGYLAAHPRRLSAFVRFVRQAGVAQASLAKGLAEILPQL